jgi:glycosyltransferase involved in cell wall biosynthesis
MISQSIVSAPPHHPPVVDVVIPALDEQEAVGLVLDALPRALVRGVIVVDNGSTDDTAAVAARHGARVVREPRRGYGSACLAGLDAIAGAPPDVVVFLDADASDEPAELPSILDPIADGRADLVVGSRTLGRRERGALLPQARFGNWLASLLIRMLYGLEVTDLGPFRAVRWDALGRLGMRDRDFGWTAEMQVKAARAGLRYLEVPVSYRRRVGKSKISGTVSGSVRAGFKILWTIARAGRPARRQAPSPS